jgi:probable phosphoglycerate mutase
MPPKLIFVRHGEAEHNVGFHQRGEEAFLDPKYKDAALTEKGKEQARETARSLASLKILDIWSSPLTRCIETAEELFEETGAQDFYLHDNLLERLGGGHECNTRKCKKELVEKYQLLKTSYLPDFPPRWIERENEYALRQRMFMLIMLLGDIYKDYSEDSHVLVVSHADAIFSLTGKPLKNAEALTLSFKDILE